MLQVSSTIFYLYIETPNIIEHRANRNRAPEKEMCSCLTNPMSTERFLFGMWHFCYVSKAFSVTYSYWEDNSKIHEAYFLCIRFFQHCGLVIVSSWLYLSTLVLLWLCHSIWYTTLSCRIPCHGLLASEAFWEPFALASVLSQGTHLWPRVCYRSPTSSSEFCSFTGTHLVYDLWDVHLPWPFILNTSFSAVRTFYFLPVTISFYPSNSYPTNTGLLQLTLVQLSPSFSRASSLWCISWDIPP